jgi:hypothetical protein
VAILPYSAFDWLDRYDASTHDIGLVFDNTLSQETVDLLAHAGEWHGRLWVVTEGTTRGDPANGAERWLADHAFVGTETWVEGYRIVPYTFGAMPDLEPVAGVFGSNEIVLTGYAIAPAARPDGGWINVALRWEAIRTPAADYTVFVHLLDASGALVAQHDGPPAAGYAPIGGWSAGDTVLDRRSVALPAPLLPGEYRLVVGLYDPTTGQRLSLADGSGDSLALSQLHSP